MTAMPSRKPTEIRIYATDRRRKLNSRVHWVSFIGVPQMLITTARLADHRWMIFVFSCLVALAVYCIKGSRAKRNQALLELNETLLPAFEDKHGRSLAGLLPVGLCQDKTSRSYEGDAAWDVGYLEVNDCFRYYGDVFDLHLARHEIESIRVVSASFPRLWITYWNAESKQTDFVAIHVRDGGTAVDQYATLQRIRAQIALMPSAPAATAAVPAQARPIPSGFGAVQVSGSRA